MSINKRVFGTPITGSVRDELQRRQNQGEIQFGDSSLWWFVARVNNLTTNNIPAGTSLRIPATTVDAEGS